MRLECHGFCLSQLFRENEYKMNYEEALNYLTLFILPHLLSQLIKPAFYNPQKEFHGGISFLSTV